MKPESPKRMQFNFDQIPHKTCNAIVVVKPALMHLRLQLSNKLGSLCLERLDHDFEPRQCDFVTLPGSERRLEAAKGGGDRLDMLFPRHTIDGKPIAQMSESKSTSDAVTIAGYPKRP
jgi:hypothetical protein